MGHKTAETIHNINNTFGPELLTNIQCSSGSSSSAKETRALKIRSTVAGHGSWQQPIERIIKPDPLTTAQDVAEELKS